MGLPNPAPELLRICETSVGGQKRGMGRPERAEKCLPARWWKERWIRERRGAPAATREAFGQPL